MQLSQPTLVQCDPLIFFLCVSYDSTTNFNDPTSDSESYHIVIMIVQA